MQPSLDFLDQLAESLGLDPDEAETLLGQWLKTYEPASDGDVFSQAPTDAVRERAA